MATSTRKRSNDVINSLKQSGKGTRGGSSKSRKKGKQKTNEPKKPADRPEVVNTSEFGNTKSVDLIAHALNIKEKERPDFKEVISFLNFSFNF